MMKKIAWIMAGLDPTGGAGIQNDVRSMAFFQVHACTILTGIASQNNQQVSSLVNVPFTIIEEQFTLLRHFFYPQAVKLGMMTNKNIIQLVADLLAGLNTPVIADPILATSSGYELLPRQDINNYIKKIFPVTTLLMPNLVEAQCLLKTKLNSTKKIEQAALSFINMGVQQVIIKGGHWRCHEAADYWTNGKESFWLRYPKLIQRKIRGTGCAFSSALTANIAQGKSIEQSFFLAKNYVYQGIQQAWQCADGHYFLEHSPRQFTEPSLHDEALQFYPIVDSVDKLVSLIKLKVKTAQLRIKNLDKHELAKQIKCAAQLASKHQVRLYINDYWQLAIEYGAYGVHLGQRDLLHADWNLIKQYRLRLGISTHNAFELSKAIALNPAYIAFGPVFSSPTKPHLKANDLKKLQEIRKLTTVPLVAIGGINLSNAASVLEAGADGLAVVSALDVNSYHREVPKWLTLWKKSNA